jgi:hypothetical protein
LSTLQSGLHENCHETEDTGVGYSIRLWGLMNSIDVLLDGIRGISWGTQRITKWNLLIENQLTVTLAGLKAFGSGKYSFNDAVILMQVSRDHVTVRESIVLSKLNELTLLTYIISLEQQITGINNKYGFLNREGHDPMESPRPVQRIPCSSSLKKI